MGQPRAQVIAGAVQENLRLIFEPAKCTRVNDPRAVALKLGPITVALLRIFSAARVTRFLGKRRERGAFGRLHFLACFPAVFHRVITPSIARPRRRSEPDGYFGEGGPLPIFRVTRVPFAVPAVAA